MAPRSAIILAAAAVFAGWPAAAQMRDNTEKQLDCRGNRGGRDARFCEIREQTMAAAPSLNVDADPNGGVQVKGWSRSEVLVRARVDAWAPTDSEAKSITGRVRILAQGGRIRAEGPSHERREGWSVSFEVFTPHKTSLTARANNGGVHLNDLDGVIEATTTNGGLHVARLAGRVKASTTNGGVHVQLAGDHWAGEYLDLSTTNGGVHVELPANYNALLEAGTTNGGVHIDFPVTVRGEISKHVSTKIGTGGAPLRFTTTNGGVHIGKSGSAAVSRRRAATV
jgi:hypothetical protein